MVIMMISWRDLFRVGAQPITTCGLAILFSMLLRCCGPLNLDVLVTTARPSQNIRDDALGPLRSRRILYQTGAALTEKTM